MAPDDHLDSTWDDPGGDRRGTAPTRAEAVADALAAEARALDRLCHTLEVQRLVLNGARADLLPQTGRDVESALAELRSADLLRAVTVSAAAAGMIGLPTLGQVAAAAPAPMASVLCDIGTDLERSLARAVALADENQARIGAARDLLADDELAMWSATWAEQFGLVLEQFHRLIDEPALPGERLAEVERALYEDEDERLATALIDLRVQAIAFDAAVGLLQTVGCRPLLEFISGPLE